VPKENIHTYIYIYIYTCTHSLFYFIVSKIIKWKVKPLINNDGLKLYGTNQLLVYADEVNILGAGIHSTKKNRTFRSR
jgi:hypothetical protein